MGPPTELALFAGAGGGVWTSRLLGWRTVCYVERNPWRLSALRARIADGSFDDAPIWDDLQTFDGADWRGAVDVISAGFPCQPFSLAGRQKADADERNMWPATFRVVREVQPRLVFLENTPGLLGRHGYLGQVLGDLASLGFDAEWDCLSAAALGAPHVRDRFFLLAAHPDEVVDAEAGLLQWEGGRPEQPGQSRVEGLLARWPDGPWAPEPRLDRVAHGVADRIDRLEALGDGLCPAVAATAFRVLLRRLLT